MSYITQNQIELIDKLAGQAGVVGDEYARDHYEDVQGVADLNGDEALDMIAQLREEIVSQQT